MIECYFLLWGRYNLSIGYTWCPVMVVATTIFMFVLLLFLVWMMHPTHDNILHFKITSQQNNCHIRIYLVNPYTVDRTVSWNRLMLGQTCRCCWCCCWVLSSSCYSFVRPPIHCWAYRSTAVFVLLSELAARCIFALPCSQWRSIFSFLPTIVSFPRAHFPC